MSQQRIFTIIDVCNSLSNRERILIYILPLKYCGGAQCTAGKNFIY